MPEPSCVLIGVLLRRVQVPGCRVRRGLVRLRDRACVARAEDLNRGVVVRRLLLRCACSGPCVLVAPGQLAGVLERRRTPLWPSPLLRRAGGGHPRPARGRDVSCVSPFVLSVGAVTAQTAAALDLNRAAAVSQGDRWETRSGCAGSAPAHPGVRRPRPGAARRNKPVSAATPPAPVPLGAAPPELVEPRRRGEPAPSGSCADGRAGRGAASRASRLPRMARARSSLGPAGTAASSRVRVGASARPPMPAAGAAPAGG